MCCPSAWLLAGDEAPRHNIAAHCQLRARLQPLASAKSPAESTARTPSHQQQESKTDTSKPFKLDWDVALGHPRRKNCCHAFEERSLFHLSAQRCSLADSAVQTSDMVSSRSPRRLHTQQHNNYTVQPTLGSIPRRVTEASQPHQPTQRNCQELDGDSQQKQIPETHGEAEKDVPGSRLASKSTISGDCGSRALPHAEATSPELGAVHYQPVMHHRQGFSADRVCHKRTAAQYSAVPNKRCRWRNKHYKPDGLIDLWTRAGLPLQVLQHRNA